MKMWPWALGGLLAVGCTREMDTVAVKRAPGSALAAGPRWEAPVMAEAPARRDFATAVAEARQAEGAQRLVSLAEVFQEWAGTDLAAAREAATALTDAEERLSVHEALLAAALTRDVREAIDWLRGLQPQSLAEVLLDQALSAWVQVDAPAAGAHVAGLPESDYRTLLAGEVARAWVTQDAAAAAAWSAGLADQEAREEALRAVVGAVAPENPQRAVELALLIPREGDRSAALELAVSEWWERDAAGLKAWSVRIVDIAAREQVARLVAGHREAADGVSAAQE